LLSPCKVIATAFRRDSTMTINHHVGKLFSSENKEMMRNSLSFLAIILVDLHHISYRIHDSILAGKKYVSKVSKSQELCCK